MAEDGRCVQAVDLQQETDRRCQLQLDHAKNCSMSEEEEEVEEEEQPSISMMPVHRLRSASIPYACCPYLMYPCNTGTASTTLAQH
jgi:hypothetical protein